jgi:LPXTG-site transpeptidase (sortase) family protein
MHNKSWWHNFDALFSDKESVFIAWFAVFFLGSAGILSALGLLPSEFQEDSSGTSFVQSAERSAQNYLYGSPAGPGPNSEGVSSGGTQQKDVVYINGVYTPFNPPKIVSNTPITGTKSSSSVGGTNSINQGGGNSAAPGNQKERVSVVPDRLVIPSIDVDTVVRNPTSSKFDDLDYELTKGTVRYPGSGTIGNSNMFIFGHSTGYKVVINKAYKVFNDIKNLSKGDQIFLKSGNDTFTYAVTSVQKVNKNSTEIVFNANSAMLTLATCDSFGAKTDRYIVEAVYVGKR